MSFDIDKNRKRARSDDISSPQMTLNEQRTYVILKKIQILPFDCAKKKKNPPFVTIFFIFFED